MTADHARCGDKTQENYSYYLRRYYTTFEGISLLGSYETYILVLSKVV